jgi:hypothetical protein
MLEELPPPEADRLKKRFDAWRQAMDRLKSDASLATEDEPLFASALEIST